MKNQFHLSGIAFGMLLVLCVRASAVETDVRWGMSEKWSRGLVNAVSGWYEFPMQIHKGYDEGVGFIDAPAGNRSMGALFGTARGISHAIGRTGWGIIEFTGFWTSNHTTNTELRLLLDGNYAWEDGEKKSFRCPDVKAGMNRTGNRFKRGVQNVLFGWVEIPGQLHKSVKQGECSVSRSPQSTVVFNQSNLPGIGRCGLCDDSRTGG